IGTSTFSAIGFGAMGLSGYYGAVESDEERFKVLDAAYAAGCTFWDTANIYADSEELLGKWFQHTGKRADIFLATKFGFKSDMSVDGTPENLRASAAASFEKLGVDTIDLFYLHVRLSCVRVIEQRGVVSELQYLMNDEAAHMKVKQVDRVHTQLRERRCRRRAEVLRPAPFAELLGVRIVAYSPLGRGLLTGQYKSTDDFDGDDFRKTIPRYNAANFPNILKIADGLKAIGAKCNKYNNGGGATAGQVALAWLLAQGEDVIPIPGTKKIKYLNENIAAAALKLSAEDVQAVRDVAMKADAAQGERYPEGMVEQMFVETPAL
ncbi:Aldo keto reductase, partial [Mycena filopes]